MSAGSETSYQTLYLLPAGALTVFLGLCFLSPYLCPFGTVTGLDGIVGRIDHSSLWDSYDTVPLVMYTIGDWGCHQEQARTWMLNGNELPFCIRDLCIMIGFAIGFLYHSLKGPLVDDMRRALLIGCVLILLTMIEWSAEHYLGLGDSAVRALVSLVSGFGAVILLDAFLRWEDSMLKRRFADRKN